MKAKKSRQTEILLRQLFSGDSALRERALYSVAPQDREGVRKLLKVRKDVELLFQVMMADLGFASSELRKNFANQFWRRTAIRALTATIDGTIFTLKQLAFVSDGLIGTQLDSEEMEFLREQQISPAGRKARLPGFRDNFKRTFKLFAKVHGTPCSTDFGQKGFEALCATVELRHRVTHPKSFMTFCVKDDESRRAGDAIDWLSSELERLLSASHDALGTMLPTDTQ